jgi:hypothetical protein
VIVAGFAAGPVTVQHLSVAIPAGSGEIGIGYRFSP